MASRSASALQHSIAAWRARLVRLALGEALEQPGYLGQQVSAPRGELAQRGRRAFRGAAVCALAG